MFKRCSCSVEHFERIKYVFWTGWNNVVMKKIGTEDCGIDYSNEYNKINSSLYERFNFPCVHLTKREILQIAKQESFDDLLYLTFSCWFPVDGKHCGKCDMCSHRII